MKKYILKTFLTFFLFGLLFSYSKAEDLLPEVMVGNPRVFYGSPATNIYGGFSGSEVVYNHTNDTGSTNTAPGQIMGENLSPSMVFNGTNSYVDAGTAPSITGTGAFTFSTWFKRAPGDIAGKGKRIIMTQALGSGEWVRLMIESDWDAVADSGDRIMFYVFGGGPKELRRYSEVKILPTDTAWHHIVAVRGDPYNDAGVTKSCGKLFVDGVLQNYINPNNSPECGPVTDILNSTPGVLSIGKGGMDALGIYGNYFKGNIDDTRIYDRALSSTEILQMYRGTFDEMNKTNLKAHWKLDEIIGGIVADSSGNNNSATVYNASLDATEGPLPLDPDSQNKNQGYDLFGFDKTALANCVNGIILGQDSCFISNSSMTNVTVMNSRTYINDQPATEVATLLYPPKPLIVGDAYLGALDPNNFAYWGKNLIENKIGNGSTNAYWGIGSYSNVADSDLANYRKKIDLAQSEATVISSIPTTTDWYLQGSTIIDSNNADISKYTNGKIWYYNGNVTIPANTTINYSGKGTVIINGNLTLFSGATIKPLNTDSRLGIIVVGSGNISLAGKNKIQATVLGYNNFIIGSNSTLMGSFVASRFQSLEDPVSITNTRLIYDTGLNKAWPPIFGELNMPHSSEQ